MTGKNLLVRVTLAVFGAASIGWSIAALFISPAAATIDRVAERIVRAEAYAVAALDRVSPTLDVIAASRWSRASSIRSSAVIELRQAEVALAEGHRVAIDDRMTALGTSLQRSLSVAPTDSFLWLALFWRDNTVMGFDASRLSLLAMSYRLGPNEGWIGVRRSPLALALFSRLPEGLVEPVVAEFIGLVNSGFPEVAAILVGPGWSARDTLLPRLAVVREPARKALARAVYQAGADIDVPGIARPDDRPWRR